MAKLLDYNGLLYFWGKFKSRLLPSGGSSGQVLAKASGTNYDVTWVDQSGGSVSMEDTEVDAAVEAAWPATIPTVTVSLTNPVSGNYFYRCDICYYENDEAVSPAIGTIESPSGSATVMFDNSQHQYLAVVVTGSWGASYSPSDITCTGGVVYYTSTPMNERLFTVTDSGTITIDGIDYGD